MFQCFLRFEVLSLFKLFCILFVFTTSSVKISACSCCDILVTTHTHTHPFNSPLSGATRVRQYQKGKNQSGFY